MEIVNMSIGFLTFAVPGAILISMICQQFNHEKQKLSGTNESASHKDNRFF